MNQGHLEKLGGAWGSVLESLLALDLERDTNLFWIASLCEGFAALARTKKRILGKQRNPDSGIPLQRQDGKLGSKLFGPVIMGMLRWYLLLFLPHEGPNASPRGGNFWGPKSTISICTPRLQRTASINFLRILAKTAPPQQTERERTGYIISVFTFVFPFWGGGTGCFGRFEAGWGRRKGNKHDQHWSCSFGSKHHRAL